MRQNYVRGRQESAVALWVVAAGLSLAAAWSTSYGAPGAPPAAVSAPAVSEDSPLAVRVRPQVGFAPLSLHVETRQHTEALRGREVCLQVVGFEFFSSCWRSDDPAVLVTRDFVLHTPGEYEVSAVVGNRLSNRETIVVK